MDRTYITELKKDGTILVTVLMLLLSVIVTSLSFYSIRQYQLEMLTGGLYRQDSLVFTIVDQGKTTDWRELDTDQPFTVFVEADSYRAIYYHKTTYIPPMVTGRFFREEDFYVGEMKMVCGQAVPRETIQRFEQIGYESIGIMGAHYASAIDDLVLVNIDAMIPTDNVHILYSNQNLLDNDTLPVNGELSIQVIDREDASVLRFLDGGYSVVSWFVVLLIVGIVFLATHYWTGKKTMELYILWLSGIRIWQPYQRFASFYLVLLSLCYWLVGLVSATGMLAFFSIQEVRVHIVNLLSGYILFMFSSAFSLWMAFRRLKKNTG